MPLFPSVAQRDRRDELMDDPRLSGERHDAALRGLSRINWVSGSARVVWRSIYKFAKQNGCKKLRVLDIATGSGDIPIALWKKASAHDLELDIQGIDVSQRAVQVARQRAATLRVPVSFKVQDALGDELPGDYDVITTSLFCHHLEEEQIIALLTKMCEATRRLLLVNDLVRSRFNLLAVQLASWLLTRSDVVHVDGPLSVRAAFTLDEFRRFSELAGLQSATISKRWPCRFVVEWSKR